MSIEASLHSRSGALSENAMPCRLRLLFPKNGNASVQRIGRRSAGNLVSLMPGTTGKFDDRKIKICGLLIFLSSNLPVVSCVDGPGPYNVELTNDLVSPKFKNTVKSVVFDMRIAGYSRKGHSCFIRCRGALVF